MGLRWVKVQGLSKPGDAYTVQLLYKFAPTQKFYTQTQHQILQLHKPIVKIEPTKKNPYLNYTIAMNTTTATTRALTNSTSLQSHHKHLARKWLGQLRCACVCVRVFFFFFNIWLWYLFWVRFDLDIWYLRTLWFAGINDKMYRFCLGVALSF